MREQLQARFSPLTDGQKWLIFFALIPLAPAISMLCLYLGWGRSGVDDLMAGYIMMLFALPYSFFHTLTFHAWFEGDTEAGVLALFWLPFIVAHLHFFFTRSGKTLTFLIFLWLVAAPRWHYYALGLLERSY